MEVHTELVEDSDFIWPLLERRHGLFWSQECLAAFSTGLCIGAVRHFHELYQHQLDELQHSQAQLIAWDQEQDRRDPAEFAKKRKMYVTAVDNYKGGLHVGAHQLNPHLRRCKHSVFVRIFR